MQLVGTFFSTSGVKFRPIICGRPNCHTGFFCGCFTRKVQNQISISEWHIKDELLAQMLEDFQKDTRPEQD